MGGGVEGRTSKSRHFLIIAFIPVLLIYFIELLNKFLHNFIGFTPFSDKTQYKVYWLLYQPEQYKQLNSRCEFLKHLSSKKVE